VTGGAPYQCFFPGAMTITLAGRHPREHGSPDRKSPQAKERSVAIRVGTAGFSYQDWRGPFYPEAIKPPEMLPFYAKQFSTVEIDATYYRVLPASTFRSMVARTPENFKFTVKLPGSVTHAGSNDAALSPDLDAWRESLDPLVEGGKFGCGVAQFPTSFRPSATAIAYLRELRKHVDLPTVIEFRHREWQTNETLDLLRELHLGLVDVDQPQFRTLMRPSSDVVGPIGYVRMHGRNVANWWKGDNVTRYDYEYSAKELAPWVHRIHDMEATSGTKDVYVVFNNHALGKAPRNAAMLKALLAPG
jgi:uncharacterized protein YecE (DUF72 family)